MASRERTATVTVAPVMADFFRNSWHQHGKFFGSVAIGGAAWAGAAAAHLRMPLAVAGDVFFLSFIVAFVLALGRLDTGYLKNRAKVEDEGAGIVSLIIVAVVAYTCVAIFATLNDKKQDDPVWLAILLAGAPLGWFVIQLNEAAHYSHLYYREQHRGSKARPPLDFHDKTEPGIWEFLYFSFVIGMTMQTSDTNVLTTPMRRATTWHAVVSFFFNTILIAMAVNAVVSRSS
ncbi:MAG TPA: DUF1345 domain-containing protein [Rhizomicrobium sp.]|nr:DUF1345 domain-containing protein [Rhizomicrobium sp.]